MRININQLYVFYLVGLHKSVTIAAKKLHVSKPAVSMQIKNLEDWLGFNLFEREKKAFILNKTGKTLYESVTPMFAHVKDVEEQIQNMLELEEAELRLGTHHLPGNYFIPDLIAHARNKHPNLKINIELGTQDVLLDRLFQSQLDVVLIISEAPKDSNCKTVLLFKEELAFVTSSGSHFAKLEAVNIERLSTMPIILQQHGTGALRSVLDFYEKHKIKPNILLNNLSSDVIKQFLHKMQACSFINRFIVQKEIDEGILHEIKINGANPTSSFHLAYTDSTKLKNFLTAIADFSPNFLRNKHMNKEQGS